MELAEPCEYVVGNRKKSDWNVEEPFDWRAWFRESPASGQAGEVCEVPYYGRRSQVLLVATGQLLESAALEFHQLVEQWLSERPPSSFVERLIVHPAYQRIIGMGPAVIPLLLQELKRKPDHWFWALNAITGADPVKSEHRGKINQMAEDWLKWGKEQGYLD